MMAYFNSKLYLALALAGMTTAPHAADLFRWTDENGKVHYSDHVPPQYIQGGYRVISEQGLTIQTIAPHEPPPKEEPKKTAAQIAEERRLLTSYNDTSDIRAARDRKIQDIKIIISLSQETTRLLEEQFQQLTKEASDYEKRGLDVPPGLQDHIAVIQDKIVKYQTANEKHQKQLEETQQFYEKELLSYQQLTQALGNTP